MDIAHGDIKPDNFLIRHVPGTFSTPSIQLIDFGKAVDLQVDILSHDEEESESSDEENVDEYDLTEEEKEEREIEKNEKEAEKKQKTLFTDLGAGGNYHLDYYGVAGVAYCLLFGKYIEVGSAKNKWVAKGSYQRRWQSHVWVAFFDQMLNPKGGKESLPCLLKWRERFLEMMTIPDLQEGMLKAREYLEAKILAKMRRTL